MNKLPKVLQNEIWEYVHGDRPFWKKQFEHVRDELNCAIASAELRFWGSGNIVSAPRSTHIVNMAKDHDVMKMGYPRLNEFRQHHIKLGTFFVPDSLEEWAKHCSEWSSFVHPVVRHNLW